MYSKIFFLKPKSSFSQCILHAEFMTNKRQRGQKPHNPPSQEKNVGSTLRFVRY